MALSECGLNVADPSAGRRRPDRAKMFRSSRTRVRKNVAEANKLVHRPDSRLSGFYLSTREE